MDGKQHYMASMLLECIKKADIEYSRKLLVKGANPNLILEDGATPFHVAVGLQKNDKTSLEFTQLMLQFGADPNVRSREGSTPLHTAAAYGRSENLRLLLQHGGDPDLLDQDEMNVDDNLRVSGDEMCRIYMAMYRAQARPKPQHTSATNCQVTSWTPHSQCSRGTTAQTPPKACGTSQTVNNPAISQEISISHTDKRSPGMYHRSPGVVRGVNNHVTVGACHGTEASGCGSDPQSSSVVPHVLSPHTSGLSTRPWRCHTSMDVGAGIVKTTDHQYKSPGPNQEFHTERKNLHSSKQPPHYQLTDAYTELSHRQGSPQSHRHGSPQSHRHGSPQSHRHGSPQSHRHGSPQSHRHGSPQSHRHGSPQSHRHGSPQSHRHGSPQSHRHGSPQSHRHGSPQSHRHGSPQSHRHGSPQSHRHGSPQSHRHGSPQSHRHGSPQSHRYGSPQSHRHGSPQSHRHGSPQSHRHGSPQSHRHGSPQSHRHGSPQSHRHGSPQSHRHGSPQSHRHGSPQSHRHGSPQSHRHGSPQSHRHGSPQSHRHGSPQSHRHGSPQSHRHGSPQSHRHGSPQSHRHGSPQSHRHGSPQSHRHGSPQSHRHGSPQSHRHGSPQSHRHGSPQSHRHGGSPPSASVQFNQNDKYKSDISPFTTHSPFTPPSSLDGSTTPSSAQFSFHRISDEYSLCSDVFDSQDTSLQLSTPESDVLVCQKTQRQLDGYDPELHQIDVTSPDHPSLVPRHSDVTIAQDASHASGSSGASFHTCPSPDARDTHTDTTDSQLSRTVENSDGSGRRSSVSPGPCSNFDSGYGEIRSSTAPRSEQGRSSLHSRVGVYPPEHTQNGSLKTTDIDKVLNANSNINQKLSSIDGPQGPFQNHRQIVSLNPKKDRSVQLPSNREYSCENVYSFCPSTPEIQCHTLLGSDSSKDSFEFDRSQLHGMSGVTELDDTVRSDQLPDLTQMSIFTEDNTTFMSDTPKAPTAQRYATRTARGDVVHPARVSVDSGLVASWGDVYSFPRTSSRAPSVASSTNSSCLSKPSRSGRFSSRSSRYSSQSSGASSQNSRASSVCSCSSVKTEQYLYTDKSEGYSLIETRYVPQHGDYTQDLNCSLHSQNSTVLYDWHNTSVHTPNNAGDHDVDNVMIPQEVAALSNTELHVRLVSLGDVPGPVTDTTRAVYLKRLVCVQQDPSLAGNNTTPAGLPGFLPEVRQALSGALDMSSVSIENLEVTMATPFCNPDPNKPWREGTKKCSFTYLLLDPRVTQNLPSRAKTIDSSSAFECFLRAVFYIGKGVRSRPYAHFKEAIKHTTRTPDQTAGPKVAHIMDIWAGGLGVVSLHIFQNVIPCEAYTREACMIEAMGLSRLTNKVPGQHYGPTVSWPISKRRTVGVLMLRKAFRIFLSEGERQIRPHDIKT